MKYPSKFKVKSAHTSWDVTYNEDTNLYDFVSGAGFTYPRHESSVRGYHAQKEFFEFIFPEPELVFPFTYVHKGNDQYGRAVREAYAGIAVYIDNNPSPCYAWDEDDIKNFIKEGIWIVTSVGEQKSVEPSSNPLDSTSTHTLKMDTTQATEDMNALAEAIKSVNIGLESMQKIMGEMGLGGGGADEAVFSVSNVVHTVQPNVYGTCKGN